MIRIGPVLIPILGLSISVCFVMLLPSAAQAACSLWDMSGEWTFVQSNNTSPVFTLQNTNTGLQGKAHYLAFGGFVNGSVDGTLKGDSFTVTAYWNNETTGVYEGTINPQGRVTGRTHDAQHPNVIANWYSDRNARCALLEGQKQPPFVLGNGRFEAVPPKPPAKAQGRVKLPAGTAGTAVKSNLTTCEAAWKARARNSPAAPGLEASCRAAGGTPTPPQ